MFSPTVFCGCVLHDHQHVALLLLTLVSYPNLSEQIIARRKHMYNIEA